MSGFTFYYTCSLNHLKPRLWPAITPPTPILIAASACYRPGRPDLVVPTIPPVCGPVFADSGGWYVARRYREYPFPLDAHMAWLWALQPQYAAIRDYPCEAAIAPNDDAVADRQRRTIENCAEMLAMDVPWEWVPVLQGRTVEQYLRHAEQHRQQGLLRPLMGIGSLCQRRSVYEVEAIVASLTEALPGVTFHLFGVKKDLFTRRLYLPPSVVSADSGAWGGRFGRDITAFERVRAQRGESQAHTEVAWALPRYRAGLERGMAQPKQHVALRAESAPRHARPAAFRILHCEECQYTIWTDALQIANEGFDDTELQELLSCLDLEVCPICYGPCPIRPKMKQLARDKILGAIENAWEACLP